MSLWVSDNSLNECENQCIARFCSLTQRSVYKIKKSCGTNRYLNYLCETVLSLNFTYFHRVKNNFDLAFQYVSVINKACSNILKNVPDCPGFDLLRKKTETMCKIIEAEGEEVKKAVRVDVLSTIF